MHRMLFFPAVTTIALLVITVVHTREVCVQALLKTQLNILQQVRLIVFDR